MTTKIVEIYFLVLKVKAERLPVFNYLTEIDTLASMKKESPNTLLKSK